jgi:hypothetical protein
MNRAGGMLILVALLAIGCDNTGTFESEPPLRIINLTVNTTQAALNETIQVSWDYENADQLSTHKTILIGHLFEGLTPPAETELPREARSISFPFLGPMTVFIEAESENGEMTNVAFDILFNADEFFFNASLSTSDPAYPRLGFASGQTERTIEFTNFLGIYEIGEDDGLIDTLANNPDLAGFLPTTESFRALSKSEFESERFGLVQGSAFPLLDIDFRATPEGSKFTAVSRADALLFAGAAAYDGSVITIKTDNGLVEGRENLTSDVEAIFIAIDIRTDSAGDPFITDVHVGNLAQGLVVSVFHGIVTPALTPSVLGTYQSNYLLGAGGDPELGTAFGQLMGGFISEDKTDINNNLRFIGVGLDKILWNVPFYPDTRLAAVPTVKFR